MKLSDERMLLKGVSLCPDPARETCFHVAHNDAEMTEFADGMSEPARRERLHRHMNNEVGSIEIASQCLMDFPDAPWDLRMQLARQANDECRHVEGLYQRLCELGGRKGEFPIANLEWVVTIALATLPARLAIQNRTFEAGQMDLLGKLRKMWREVGDHETAELLESILADEVNHVRFANRWIKKLGRKDPRVLFNIAMAVRLLTEAVGAYSAEVPEELKKLKFSEPSRQEINVEDRLNAGFSDEEVDEILRQSGMRSLIEIRAHNG